MIQVTLGANNVTTRKTIQEEMMRDKRMLIGNVSEYQSADEIVP